MLNKPVLKPARPYFSSGPCCKRPGWSPEALASALTGRSHRSVEGRARLKFAIDETKRILNVPPGYEIAIVPGSDTGAFELAMWNLLGGRGVDVFAWDVFGRIWLKDALDELKLPDVRSFDAPYGELPDLSQADFSRDVIFTWNGTTTGVRVPDADWISQQRSGLTMCDATSAIFAEMIDLSRIDVLTFSWQKVLGGEAAHGMLILSPRALDRLRSAQQAWPIPKIFRLKSPDGAVLMEVFEGVTINTPSLLCVEDYLDALTWTDSVGGLDGTVARAHANARIVYEWIAATPWAEPLAVDPSTYSHTSVCLQFAQEGTTGNASVHHEQLMRAIVALLASEGVAFDIAAYRGMPAGLRIWTGATVEADHLRRLMPWLDWAYAMVTTQSSS
jgi:phosphoserine aminotransferase